MVKIICDSTGDLTAEIIRDYDISIVPLNIHFGTDTYADGVTITPSEFYNKLVTDKRHPTTSAPAPGLFAEMYQKLAKETDEIFVITISGGLSATYESAIQAKNMVGNLCKIEVVDSQETVCGLFIPALKAAQAARQGAKLAEISDMVRNSVLPRVRPYMIFDTLEYLLKGGRIGKVQAMMGGVLKFNPIITLKDGVTAPVARPRSREKAMKALEDLIRNAGETEELVIEDATTPDDLAIIAQRFAKFYPADKTYRSTVSPVIGVHCGPCVIAAAALIKS